MVQCIRYDAKNEVCQNPTKVVCCSQFTVCHDSC